MSKLSAAFFSVAALIGLAGMIWGLVMGISQDFTLAPAHAHLNLVGWASLGIMGAFYGIVGDAAPRRLGWANFTCSTLGGIAFPAGLGVYLSGNDKLIVLPVAGAILAMLGMVLFLIVAARVFLRKAG